MPRKKIALALTLSALIAGTLGGCGVASTTPTGVPCTLQGVHCRYFLVDGKPVPCDPPQNHVCGNSPGEFYVYVTSTDTTLRCDESSCAEAAAPVDCTGSVNYDDLKDHGIAWKVVSQEHNENATGSPVEVTFTSTKSETVEVNTELSFEAKGDAVVAAVRAEINRAVSESVTTSIGNSTTMTIEAGQTGYAIYGVRMQVTEGRMRNVNVCTDASEDLGQVTTYVPISSGWCLWTSDQPPCRTID
ncbi:hypothetical protein [Solwaraspora sp. WMMD792]|uniref:hypothetical protein n=1 Tax=Solwaraspora sp. WMMD792 TaxID=3016099 RepID=UPI002417AAF0|nr:hypothetical protein [Solwaraspora sp. WMMD792]MDG4770392.1 hypothetical protein [Solwaraspora sp. WMMD792]